MLSKEEQMIRHAAAMAKYFRKMPKEQRARYNKRHRDWVKVKTQFLHILLD